MPRKEIYDVGGDRFFVDSDFETKFVDSGVEMKGSLFYMKVARVLTFHLIMLACSIAETYVF